MKFHLLNASNRLSIILPFKLSLSILGSILFTHVSYSQIEKLDDCAEVTSKYNFTTNGEKYYTVKVENKCDKKIWAMCIQIKWLPKIIKQLKLTTKDTLSA